MSNPYQLETYPLSELSRLKNEGDIFAIIAHGNKTQLQHEGGPFLIDIALPSLNSEKLEIWRSNEPLVSGQFKDIQYKHSDTFLFGCLALQESDFPDLVTTTVRAYEQIHDALEDTGFPALTRMWNFFPQINEEIDGLERYRSFCLGRHRALDEWHFTEDLLPAASAIGTLGDGLVIYFLAARQPGIQIENPRQISAFHYPKQYGPKSPSFSRATYKNWGNSQHLYISGTASIVGHQTLHTDDVTAQLEETLKNIQTVIEQAQSLHGLKCSGIADLNSIRVYIRHPEHTDLILSTLAQHIDEQKLCAVQGDICRSDLLLEIEGHYIASV